MKDGIAENRILIDSFRRSVYPIHRKPIHRNENMNLKGSLPLLILHVLANGDNHGYQIAKQIKGMSGDVLDFKEGTLYPTLHNLEQQGLIAGYERNENGRTRRYYRLTEDGRGSLQAERAEWERYAQAVNLVLGKAKS